MSRSRLRSVVWAAVLGVTYTGPAAAQGIWVVLPMKNRGVDATAAETFRGLLETELGTRNGARFAESSVRCGDAPCARDAGRRAGAAVALFGSLGRLGEKIVVVVNAVDVATGASRGRDRMTIDRVEDLEAVSERIAEAIISGRRVDQTAELGTITAREEKPDRRREGYSGMSLRFGGLTPIADSLSAGSGIHVGVGYWYEARDFAIEPRLRFRTSADEQSDDSWRGVDLDLGAYYVLSRSDFAPYIGGGAGLRFVDEDRDVDIVTGRTVRIEATEHRNASGTALGAFVRAGLLLFRTYSVRVTMDVDYDVTFSDLYGDGSAQTVTFGVGVLF